MAHLAQETMLALLASSTDGHVLRRGWLEALMERFDAPLGASQNTVYDTTAGTLRYADNVSIGPEAWTSLDALMEGAPIPDLASAEHAVPMNSFTLFRKEMVAPPLVEMIWVPHKLVSSLSTSVMEDGRMLGHVSIFRTESCSKQFEGNEMTGAEHPWAVCTFKMMSATHAMLSRGPKQRGAMLFHPDGSGWMDNEMPVDWASAEYREHLTAEVKRFASGEQAECELHSHNSRIVLSRLQGGDEEGVLAVVEPMATPRVSEVSRLSPTERLVSSYAARGATIPEIAVQLSRSEATIKSQLETIYERLGISSRAELSALYDKALHWSP